MNFCVCDFVLAFFTAEVVVFTMSNLFLLLRRKKLYLSLKIQLPASDLQIDHSSLILRILELESDYPVRFEN